MIETTRSAEVDGFEHTKKIASRVANSQEILLKHV